MRAIGYVRVSSQEQRYGRGLGTQEAAIRAYCKQIGLRLVSVARDKAKSGSNGLDTRVGLAEALRACEAGSADVLVVDDYSRLARDLILQETTIQQLAAAGVKVVSVTEPEGEGDQHTRDLIRQVLGAVNQYNRAVIRAKMEAGRARAVAEGRRGQGAPPYGYRAENGALVPVDSEQAVLAQLRQWQAEGLPLAEMARRLNEAGKSSRRGRWHPTSVSRALARSEP